MKRLFVTCCLLLAALGAAAQEMRATAILPLWDNASAPHSNGLGAEPAVANGRPSLTTRAELYLYAPDPTVDKRMAVVICPGGGYHHLSMENEGARMAEWFAANGYTAAVLRYRMPNGRPEVPLEDAERALRTMMGLEAGATGFTADRVGIVGSSAGGHLAAMASNLADPKPAFAILFYPVITGDASKRHKGSFDNLLGEARTEEQTRRYSLENRVTEQTPPTLLLLADDDRTVPSVNSTRYYEALKAHGVPASMHIYPAGGHGFGMRDTFPWKAQWQAAVLDWLERLDTNRQPTTKP